MMNCVLRWSRCLYWGLAIAMVTGCTNTEKIRQAEKLVLARAHLRAERYFSALSLLHDLQPTEESAAELRLMQALAYFKLEDYSHAMVAIEQAHPQSARSPRFVLAYLNLLVGNLERASYFANSLAHPVWNLRPK